MHGEDLHPFGGDLDLAGFQPVLLCLGGIEEREERRQRGLRGVADLIDEAGRFVEESVEVAPGRASTSTSTPEPRSTSATSSGSDPDTRRRSRRSSSDSAARRRYPSAE
jgi:hypothetical protein